MTGNVNFQKLVDIINRKNYKFPFDIKDPKGVRGVQTIRKRILSELEEGSSETIDFFTRCFLDKEIQDIFDIKKPQITDYSELLGLKKGKIYGLEFKLMGPSGSHKDLMMASLFTSCVMTPGVPWEEMIGTVDTGWPNSMNAAHYNNRKFGLKGAYFVQEDIPPNLLRQVEGDPNFEVVKVPSPVEGGGIDKKNATYRALLKRYVTDKDFKNRMCYLGHAELGTFFMHLYGEAFVEVFKQEGIKPDIFLSPMGAGTTLFGIGLPMKYHFGTELDIGEYEEFGPFRAKLQKFYGNDKMFRGVIHPDLEVIPEEVKNQTNSIDEALLVYLDSKGYNNGLTSTSTILCAVPLAEEGDGKTVTVPIFEGYRRYARETISRQIQVNPFIPDAYWKELGGIYHLERQKSKGPSLIDNVKEAV